jgi:hypothetical protein
LTADYVSCIFFFTVGAVLIGNRRASHMINRFTFFVDQAKAASLAATLKADDPETDYQVVEGSQGFFVAIFEDGVQVFSI